MFKRMLGICGDDPRELLMYGITFVFLSCVTVASIEIIRLFIGSF